MFYQLRADCGYLAVIAFDIFKYIMTFICVSQRGLLSPDSDVALSKSFTFVPQFANALYAGPVVFVATRDTVHLYGAQPDIKHIELSHACCYDSFHNLYVMCYEYLNIYTDYKLVHTARVGRYFCNSLAFSPDESMLYALTNFGKIICVNALTYEITNKIKTHMNATIKTLSTGDLVVCDQQKIMLLSRTGARLRSWSTRGPLLSLQVDRADSLIFLGSNDRLFLLQRDNTITCWHEMANASLLALPPAGGLLALNKYNISFYI